MLVLKLCFDFCITSCSFPWMSTLLNLIISLSQSCFYFLTKLSVPQPGTWKPAPPAVKVQSFNHWIARESPHELPSMKVFADSRLCAFLHLKPMVASPDCHYLFPPACCVWVLPCLSKVLPGTLGPTDLPNLNIYSFYSHESTEFPVPSCLAQHRWGNRKVSTCVVCPPMGLPSTPPTAVTNLLHAGNVP